MAHLQEVGPIVPQDADDSGIGQRPTSTGRRSTSTSATASPARNGIPERSDQIARRKAKGTQGGRPLAFDPEIYRHSNTVERGFNRLKHWRGIATR